MMPRSLWLRFFPAHIFVPPHKYLSPHASLLPQETGALTYSQSARRIRKEITVNQYASAWHRERSWEMLAGVMTGSRSLCFSWKRGERLLASPCCRLACWPLQQTQNMSLRKNREEQGQKWERKAGYHWGSTALYLQWCSKTVLIPPWPTGSGEQMIFPTTQQHVWGLTVFALSPK